jgi:streptogramin lyase
MTAARRSDRWVRSALLLSVLVFGVATSSRADTILYATSQNVSQIYSVDVTTNTVTPLFSTTSPADSLIFDTQGNIIYSLNQIGQVWSYNPNTHVNTMLVNFGSGTSPADLALEPGGNSVLVSLFSTGQIERINLATHAVSQLGTYGGNPEGVTYDNAGRLFANLGVRDNGANKFVAQLDPVTGAILHQSANYTSLDGLTYDSFTGHLYAASLNGNNIVKVDPNNLSVSSILPNSGVGAPDGIEGDGQGLLYIGSRNDFHIYSYNLTSNALTQLTFIDGLDDIAPVAGLGAPVPEPSSIAQLVVGLAALGGLRAWVRRRRRDR